MADTESRLKACEEFFESFPPPDDLEEIKKKTKDFVQKHQKECRPLVLITVSSNNMYFK